MCTVYIINKKNDAIHTAGRVQVDCILPIHTAGHVYGQNAINLQTAGRHMATLDVAKLLLLTNQTKLSKLTLTVALTLTDTVTVIFLRAFRWHP